MNDQTAPRTQRRSRSPRGQGASLRADLVAAAFELLSAEQPVTLRAVARRARVSPMAPYNQFEDLDEILVELKKHCYSLLADHLRRAVPPGGDPHRRLVDLLLAYAEYGLANPGPYKIMFASPVSAPGTVGIVGREPLDLLLECVAGALGRDAADPQVLADSVLLWSAVHGITHLRLMEATPPRPPLAEEIDECVSRMIR